MEKSVTLTDLDFEILKRLKKNAQEPLTKLSRKLEHPRSTIHSRIKRLENAGVISKYSIDIDLAVLGYTIIAFVMISFDQYQTDLNQEQVATEIGRIGEVEEVHIIAGEWDMLVKIHAKSIEELGSFAVKKLKSIDGVGKSITYISLKPIKLHHQLP